MSLVFAGVCSHAPGITSRAELCEPELRDPFHNAFYEFGDAVRDSGAEALMIVAAEHFANFFMNNMPSICIGMADYYEGPIEDPEWLKIERRRFNGNPALSRRLVTEIMQTSDVAYAEEWKFDHGISVPLEFIKPGEIPLIPVNINCQGPPLLPLHRAWAFGEAMRRACDSVPEKIALIGTGGISHWPATPDSGKINEAWDRDFLDKLLRQDKQALLAYNDVDTYADGGQGGFEIRTFMAVAAAAGGEGTLIHYAPIPIFAVGCTIATLDIAA